jgi:hypothetical protein
VSLPFQLQIDDRLAGPQTSCYYFLTQSGHFRSNGQAFLLRIQDTRRSLRLESFTDLTPHQIKLHRTPTNTSDTALFLSRLPTNSTPRTFQQLKYRPLKKNYTQSNSSSNMSNYGSHTSPKNMYTGTNALIDTFSPVRTIPSYVSWLQTFVALENFRVLFFRSSSMIVRLTLLTVSKVDIHSS